MIPLETVDSADPLLPPVPAFLSLEHALQVPVPITYIAGIFPARSETFVYREVRALRLRGWNVQAVSLNDAPQLPVGDFQDLCRGTLTVYGNGFRQTLIAFPRESILHPTTTAKTLYTAMLDAIAPGEATSWKSRLKLLAQSVAAIGLAGRLRDTRTRHIHCHFAHASTTIGMYAAMQLGVPFSFTGHANDLFQRRILLKHKLERAAFVACISRWHRNFYQRLAPNDDSKYPVIRCGVDIQTWGQAPSASSSSDKLRLLTVCRLVEKKGVDTLLSALAKFGESTHQPWHLTIAGDGPEWESLRKLAARLRVSERVLFLGAVDNDKVRELLKSADVFVLACRTDTAGDRDGIPVVLMEAMACGVPVISGDLPAIRELVEPNVAGLLVDASNPAALVEAIRNLADNVGYRQALAAAGRAAVEREFRLDVNVGRLENLFESSMCQGSVRSMTSADKTGTISASNAPAIHVTNGFAPQALARRYALITPCRDEAKYARRTLDSVTRQTIPPAIWVIVDDGSKDETPQILAEYAAKFPYIKIVTRADRGDRKLGGGVIDAFYAGYDTINPDDYDYICKFDLDLDLPCRYFETLMERMEQNPRIGTCSGKPYFVLNGQTISEKCGDENSVGMIKFYRTQCFKQIGGFVRELMWDGIDCHRCRMDGWIAISWDDPAINFEHLRPMGTSHKNWWTGRVRHGVGQWFMGTGLSYMMASALFRMTRPPLIVGGLAMLWGYIRSMFQRRPRYGDMRFRRFLRAYQWNCLIHGKAQATERLNNAQASLWQSMTKTH